MNKTKMILAGTGGAIGLVVLVLAFLVWQAFSAKSVALEGDDEEGVEGLETVESRAQTLSRKPVYPCKESLAAIEKSLTLVEGWKKDALALAARGDKVFKTTTPAAFKTFLVSDAKRISELPGGVAGKLVKPDFAFGPFKDYIAGGVMPEESKLAELQRKWDDVATVAGILSKCGASELVDVQFAVVAKETEAGSGEQGKKRKKSGKASGKKGQDDVQRPLSQSYVFTFLVRPSAFVRTVNELTASERFITVDAFTFDRASDVIASALGGDEKKKEDAAASGGRRGRRGRRGAEAVQEKPQDAGEETALLKNGIITDPLLDAPFKAVVTVSVHDFRSLEEKNEASAEEKGAAK